MIPKIIHQTAPEDKELWHPCWIICQKSIIKQFSSEEFQYILWNDEQMDRFIEEKYSNYWDRYKSIEDHIIKIDIFRYFIMHFYGGIYMDMDIFCHKNFYKELGDFIYIVESGHPSEVVQNSIMASNGEEDFWISCIEETLKRYENHKNKTFQDFSYYVHITSGPKLLEDMYKLHKPLVNIKLLNSFNYNMGTIFYHENAFTIHMSTGQWGEEVNKEAISNCQGKNLMEKKLKNYALTRLNGFTHILKLYEGLVKDD